MARPIKLTLSVLVVCLLIAVSSFLILTVLRGPGPDSRAVAGRITAHAESLRGFHLEGLAAAEKGPEWFDGGGPVRDMILMPGDGLISFLLCTMEVEPLLRTWPSKVRRSENALEEDRFLIELEWGERLMLRASDEQDPFLIRLFAGPGDHDLSIFGQEPYGTAELRHSIPSDEAGYSFDVRDTDARLIFQLQGGSENAEAADVSVTTGTLPEGAHCWIADVFASCSVEFCSERATVGESIRFEDISDGFLGVKGQTDRLLFEGVTTDISVGDDELVFTKPISMLEIAFEDFAIFDISFSRGEVLLEGNATSVNLNGVEQISNQWPDWLNLSGRAAALLVTSIVSALVGAIVTAIVTGRLEDRPKRIRNRLRELPANGDRLIAFPVDELHRAAIDEGRALAVDLGMLAHEELD